MRRRYLVRGLAQSPLWSGTLWAYGCNWLSSAELLFEKQRANAEFDILELVDRTDRDERTGEYRVLRRTTVTNQRVNGTRH
ncbi:hypothetical protein ACN2CC_18230 [Mesorhizobium muleiense]|uniref:hypothetical protein n=1 Tax=Mesorhizobium TaxID=68287 RepID=UPI000FE803A2|nr:hypothetical protein [Mesorhizobium sp.]RWP11816.1 MAG: hypothetical protein EOR00_27935 [Mesorhizobium sp.]